MSPFWQRAIGAVIVAVVAVLAVDVLRPRRWTGPSTGDDTSGAPAARSSHLIFTF